MPGFGAALGNNDIRSNLYFMWSLERMCVVLGLNKIGNWDWHAWGSEWLVANQSPNGSWRSRFGELPDTSFGLMFLLKANIVRDLTHILKASSKPESGDSHATNSDGDKKAKDSEPGQIANSSFSTLARTLVNSSPDKQSVLIKEYADKHGSDDRLAEAIPLLKAHVKDEAREALATRMSRQKTTTLREWLIYDNAEIRRVRSRRRVDP